MKYRFENQTRQHIMIIGGGITGLSAAVELSGMNTIVSIIEKSDQLGGHAVRLTCKATDKCVKCGACKVIEKIEWAMSNADIRIHLNSTLTGIIDDKPFTVNFRNGAGKELTSRQDSIIITTGFQPFQPETKPYGYHRFDNVITSLELEIIMKEHCRPRRPSDGREPENIAFIQCVGSRDASLNHLWCSKFCCPSSLRMADLIRSVKTDTKITFFYIDFQNCGRNYQRYQAKLNEHIRTVRAIPGDIFKTEKDRLNLSFFDPRQCKPVEEVFDLVVLSVGMTPNRENHALSEILEIDLTDFDFIYAHEETGRTSREGVFAAGTALSPMTIEESLSSGIKTAHRVMKYLINENR